MTLEFGMLHPLSDCGILKYLTAEIYISLKESSTTRRGATNVRVGLRKPLAGKGW